MKAKFIPRNVEEREGRVVYFCSECEGKGAITKELLADALKRLEQANKEKEDIAQEMQACKVLNGHLAVEADMARRNQKLYAEIKAVNLQLQAENARLQKALRRSVKAPKPQQRPKPMKDQAIRSACIPVHLL